MAYLRAMITFKETGLLPDLVKAVDDLGFEKPTPIQEKSLSHLLDSPKDLLATAQTGTGKTAAFGLPILHHIDTSSRDVQALILCPTRELCIQIEREIQNYAKYMDVSILAVYGGTSIDPQIRRLNKGVQIVVGTPGRTLDLINRRKLKVDHIAWAVFDEADEMLSMGFKEDLDEILSSTPQEKNTLMFSATFPKEIHRMANKYMNEPAEIHVAHRNESAANVTHKYFSVSRNNRYATLKRLVDYYPEIYAIVFCRTRRETKEVSEKLTADGYNVDALHGELSQAQRDQVMAKFRGKKLQLLIATDVAARGIDVDTLTHVINFNLPDEIETYVHRSGRTGRANKKGTCYSIITPSEVRKIKQAERIINKEIVKATIPSGEEVCEKQLLALIDKIKTSEVKEEQIEPYMASIYEKLESISKEELIKKVVSLEFNKFMTYYSKAPDLNQMGRDRGERDRGDRRDRGRDRDFGGDDRNDSNFDRFFLNVGSKDGLEPKNIIGIINDNLPDQNLDIGEIEILKSFSFFEVESGNQEAIIGALSGKAFKDQTLNVEVTQKKKSSGSGRRDRKRSDRGSGGGGGYGGGRSSGGGNRRGGSSGGYGGSSSNSGGKGRERKRRF